jgi:hypothetical protein
MNMQIFAPSASVGQNEIEFNINLAIMRALKGEKRLNLDKLMHSLGDWFAECDKDVLSNGCRKVLNSIDFANINPTTAFKTANELNN